jgi:hypothetical protein
MNSTGREEIKTVLASWRDGDHPDADHLIAALDAIARREAGNILRRKDSRNWLFTLTQLMVYREASRLLEAECADLEKTLTSADCELMHVRRQMGFNTFVLTILKSRWGEKE